MNYPDLEFELESLLFAKRSGPLMVTTIRQVRPEGALHDKEHNILNRTPLQKLLNFTQLSAQFYHTQAEILFQTFF